MDTSTSTTSSGDGAAAAAAAAGGSVRKSGRLRSRVFRISPGDNSRKSFFPYLPTFPWALTIGISIPGIFMFPHSFTWLNCTSSYKTYNRVVHTCTTCTYYVELEKEGMSFVFLFVLFLFSFPFRKRKRRKGGRREGRKCSNGRKEAGKGE